MERKLLKGRWRSWPAVPAALAVLTAATWMPAGGAATGAPEKIVINHIQKQYGPVTFDHGMHAALAGGCGTCHHEHNDKVKDTCGQCHTVTPAAFKSSVQQGFLPCSGCHGEPSADEPGIPGLKVALHKTCFSCHVGIGELGASPQGCVRTCHAKSHHQEGITHVREK